MNRQLLKLSQSLLVGGLLFTSLGGCSLFPGHTFLPSQENRFLVVGWEVGHIGPLAGWAYAQSLTLKELRKFCGEQVCYVHQQYIRAGSNTISAELDTPTALAIMMDIPNSKIKRIDHNVYAIDLRYQYRYFPNNS